LTLDRFFIAFYNVLVTLVHVTFSMIWPISSPISN